MDERQRNKEERGRKEEHDSFSQGEDKSERLIHTTAQTCQFEQINQFEVRCIYCGRALSGTPERYNGRLICKERGEGPGTELEKIFKWWGKRLGVDYTPCNKCKKMRQEMDFYGKEWVKKNSDGLTEQIRRNAERQGVIVPTAMIKYWLKKVSK